MPGDVQRVGAVVVLDPARAKLTPIPPRGLGDKATLPKIARLGHPGLAFHHRVLLLLQPLVHARLGNVLEDGDFLSSKTEEGRVIRECHREALVPELLGQRETG